MKVNTEWKTSDANVFWGEIAPAEHVVQIYENDEVFLDALEAFVISGFQSNESVIIIATTNHLIALDERLSANGYNTNALISGHQYRPLEAEETLNKFMVNGWPDAQLFHNTVSQIIKEAKTNERNVRAFGEMVAILWAKGLTGATVHLENLWSRFCQTESFCLFCAYPKNGFTQDLHSSLNSICCAHSKMISGQHRSKTEIFYKTVQSVA